MWYVWMVNIPEAVPGLGTANLTVWLCSASLGISSGTNAINSVARLQADCMQDKITNDLFMYLSIYYLSTYQPACLPAYLPTQCTYLPIPL